MLVQTSFRWSTSRGWLLVPDWVLQVQEVIGLNPAVSTGLSIVFGIKIRVSRCRVVYSQTI